MDLRAGQELDKLVAEKLISWAELTIVVTTGLPTQLQGIKPGTIASPYTGYKPKFVVPEYSTDIKAAWEVIDKVDGEWKLEGQEKVGWEVSLVEASMREDRYGNPFKANADSAPHAICLAALKAIEQL